MLPYVKQTYNFKVGTVLIGKKKLPDFHEVTLNPKGHNRFWIEAKFHASLNDIIKSMGKATYHGYDDVPIKKWSVANDQRTEWVVKYRDTAQPDPYKFYRRPDEDAPITRQILNKAQRDMVNHIYTKGTIIAAHEMGLGKTLAAAHAIEIMHPAGAVWWIGPRPALAAADYEFRKWQINFKPIFMTYNKLNATVENWQSGDVPPQAVVFDECSKIKNIEAQVSKAALRLTSSMREEWGSKSIIILMSGTPSPKTPVDWYSPAEVAQPGFLKEGNIYQFRKRLAVMSDSIMGGRKFEQVVRWRDQEGGCVTCGRPQVDVAHPFDHIYKPGVNEVANLYKRLQGLVQVRFLKDSVDLPERIYKVIRCRVDPSTRRYADLAKLNARNALAGLVIRREISDGFIYDKTPDGMIPCPVCKGSGQEFGWVTSEGVQSDKVLCPLCEGTGCEACQETGLIEVETDGFQECTQQFVNCSCCKGKGEVVKFSRSIREVKCPKDDILKDLLELNEDASRIVVYAGFSESVDRCVRTCIKHGWNVIRLDGRGWAGYQADGSPWTYGTQYLDIFQDSDISKIAFVGNPVAGGMGLTLTRARSMVYYSNSYIAEARQQSERRIHRQGMDLNRGATIYDIIHLPEDEKVLQALLLNKKLQSLTLGEFDQIEKEFKNAGLNYEVVE